MRWVDFSAMPRPAGWRVKLLWVSDSPTSPSGFGAVTHAATRGHAVEILGWQTRGGVKRWEGIPVHPVRRDLFGRDVLLGYLMRIRPDFLVTLADVWWLSFITDPPVQQFLDMSGTRWALYYPVDGADPSGRLPQGWVSLLERVDVPIAMSRFGVDVSRASGLEPAYVPHGCDIDVFCPPADKEAAKARLGYDGKFVVLSDSRNQPRKLLPRLLDIFAAFAAGKPDVLLHLHCDPDDDAASSEQYTYRLREDVELLGLADKVRFTPNFRMRSSGGLSDESLAALYQAADVHLLASWGEGFGLPTLQAASAGVVPLAVNYTASRELVAGHGLALPTDTVVRDEFGLVRAFLDRDAAAAALEHLYASPADLRERSRRSREFALGYSWDTVADEWERVLAEAPARRRPTRTRALVFDGSSLRTDDVEAEPLPAGVESIVNRTVSKLLGGVSASIQMAERRMGEVGAAIYHGAHVDGEPISIPVRLRPAFQGSPTARVGHLLVSPADLPLAAELRAVLPSLRFSIPKQTGDVANARALSLEELVPTLAHYALVIDLSGEAPRGTNVACAALGVPYVGSHGLWPPLPLDDPLFSLRRLLTDPGLAEQRRTLAAERLQTAVGDEVVEKIRAAAIAGQPEPKQATAPVRPVPSPELFLVRPVAPGLADAGSRLDAAVGAADGLVLLRTAGGSVLAVLDEVGKEALERDPCVGFVGSITLDDDSAPAMALKKAFVRNAQAELERRRPALAGGRR